MTYSSRFRITERAAIEACADWLISRCYKPAERGVVFDCNAQTKAFAEEPINWGDLRATAARLGNVWVVTLEEAAPGQCPALCEYIQTWLERWGWTPVIVETEW